MNFKNEKYIDFCNYIKRKKTAIIGLGVSNIPLIDFLYKLGANITVFDNRSIEIIDKEILEKITDRNIEFILFFDLLHADQIRLN